ncbi:hypothetical protein [Streptomyces sp. S186]|uniref:hypothetical protein n=1 Tax=Streptomyces sp. S186 TaxID=3434395 RepID=UPI003F661AB5
MADPPDKFRVADKDVPLAVDKLPDGRWQGTASCPPAVYTAFPAWLSSTYGVTIPDEISKLTLQTLEVQVTGSPKSDSWDVAFELGVEFPLGGVEAALFIDIACSHQKGSPVKKAATSFEAYGQLTVESPDGPSLTLQLTAAYSPEEKLSLSAGLSDNESTFADITRLFGLGNALRDLGDFAGTGGSENVSLGLILVYHSKDNAWAVSATVGPATAGIASVPVSATGARPRHMSSTS